MPAFEDEIDLRPYILELSRRWRLLILLLLVPAISTLVITLLIPREYESTATMLVTRTRATLALAQQFPTLSEPIDTRSRMDAILTIASSDAIASSTLEQLAGELPAEYRELENFKELVEIQSTGDAIQIIATAPDPGLSADIANTWARGATMETNLAYSGELPLSEIQSRAVNAREEFETAQSDLEGFIANNQVAVLESKVAEAKTLLATLTGDRTAQIAYYFNRKHLMDAVIVEAEALKNQLSSSTSSSAAGLGDALAVVSARSNSLAVSQNHPATSLLASLLTNPETPGLDPLRTFGDNSNLEIVLNFQPNELEELLTNSDSYANDLATIVAIAKVEKELAEQSLETLRNDIIGEDQITTIEETATELRTSETLLEMELAKELDLTSDRDLAWQAYQAIAQKEVEIRNAGQSENLVTMASMAIPPTGPSSRGLIRNTLIAGSIGLVFATFFILASQWWRSSNTVDFHTPDGKPYTPSPKNN